jgi:hypothetical protein
MPFKDSGLGIRSHDPEAGIVKELRKERRKERRDC